MFLFLFASRLRLSFVFFRSRVVPAAVRTAKCSAYSKAVVMLSKYAASTIAFCAACKLSSSISAASAVRLANVSSASLNLFWTSSEVKDPRKYIASALADRLHFLPPIVAMITTAASRVASTLRSWSGMSISTSKLHAKGR